MATSAPAALQGEPESTGSPGSSLRSATASQVPTSSTASSTKYQRVQARSPVGDSRKRSSLRRDKSKQSSHTSSKPSDYRASWNTCVSIYPLSCTLAVLCAGAGDGVLLTQQSSSVVLSSPCPTGPGHHAPPPARTRRERHPAPWRRNRQRSLVPASVRPRSYAVSHLAAVRDCRDVHNNGSHAGQVRRRPSLVCSSPQALRRSAAP